MHACCDDSIQPNSLSFELLAELFSHAHDKQRSQHFLRPPPFSQDCRSWRHASLIAKELWDTIAVRCKKRNSDDQRISLAQLYTERSGDLPLTVTVQSGATYHPRLIDLVRRNAWRVQSIALHSDSTSLLDALGGHAFPVLESCQLHLSTPIWPTVLVNVAFPSSEHCPKIRDLHLAGGLSEFNFEFSIPEASIRNHYIDYGTADYEQGVIWEEAPTFPFRVFNVFPGKAYSHSHLKSGIFEPLFKPSTFSKAF